nr:DotI/IcmL family type IV secretion protein [Pseudomonadota bacterium]
MKPAKIDLAGDPDTAFLEVAGPCPGRPPSPPAVSVGQADDPVLITQIVHTVDEHYRIRRANRILTATAALTAASTLLSLVALTGVFHLVKPTREYIATTADGRVYPVVTMDEPVLADKAVSEWTARAIRDTYNFSYLNLVEHFADIGDRYFIAEALLDLERAMEESGMIQAVKERELIVNGVITSAPVLLNPDDRIRDGVRTWEYAVMGVVTYVNKAERRTDQVTWRILVRRVPLAEAVDGIRIARIQHV